MTRTPRRALGPGLDSPAARSPQRAPAWLNPHPAPEPATPGDDAEQALDAIASLRMVRVPAAAVESALLLARALLARPSEDPTIREIAEGLAAVLPHSLAAARPQPAATVTPLRPVSAATVSTIGAAAGMRSARPAAQRR
ncbi:hypothetical protein ACFWA9_29125 [Kitasatospora sp. NPDC059973]|uniref:hypothetical protein n=1 Tax=Kitasatospora sp. NPDC059973 TaxID=3347020 RepID=UPI0036A367AF